MSGFLACPSAWFTFFSGCYITVVMTLDKFYNNVQLVLTQGSIELQANAWYSASVQVINVLDFYFLEPYFSDFSWLPAKLQDYYAG